MSFSIIAAIGKNKKKKKNDKLIWNLPNDLKFFKEMTTGKTIIMGRRTFDSLPRMLPNRHHVVLSLSNDFPNEVEVFRDINHLLEKYKDSNEELFVIGGASIFTLFLDYCDKLYLTEIEATDKDADVYFPEFDKSNYESELLKENEDNGIKYKHILYRKIE